MHESYHELLMDIVDHGEDVETRGLTTKELINVELKVGVDNFFFAEPTRSFKRVHDYFFGEMAWYMSGDLRPDFISKYSKFWLTLTNPDGTLNSNYGHLVFYNQREAGASRFLRSDKSTTQYEWCLQQLIKDPSSRKAVVLYNNPEYYFKENRDFICTQLQQFFIRNNTLLSTVYIRSSDAILGLSYDVPWWSVVQQSLLLDLQECGYKDLKLGETTIFIGSVHVYNDKLNLVKAMLEDTVKYANVSLKKSIPLHESASWYKTNLENNYLTINVL